LRRWTVEPGALASASIPLDPDVAKAFKTPEAVNTALRAIAEKDQGTHED